MTQPPNFAPLPEPISLAEQNWPEGTAPLVTTRTMTYMHAAFIRDCIEGILMQKTTFPVQVLIHDDASTDGTVNILREYESRYPKLIQVYYQKFNTYRLPNRRELHAEFFNWKRGKYVALCEGDDYWTHPAKLQQQVEYMDAHPTCSGCFHNGQVYFENEQRYQTFLAKEGAMPEGRTYRQLPAEKIHTHDLISLTTFIPNGSLLYRSNSYPDKFYFYDWCMKSASADICLFSMLTKDQQYLKYLDFDGLIYRKHAGGVSLTHNSWFVYLNRQRTYIGLSEFHDHKYEQAFRYLIQQHRIHGFRWLLVNWAALKTKQIQELAEELEVSQSTPIATLRKLLESELKFELSKEASQPSFDFEPYELQQPNTIRAVAPLLSGTFLDVGCGIMPYKKLLTSAGSRIERYIGLDIQTDTYQAEVDLRWDGRTIPLEDASVDSAMATEVLEHCPEPLVVLREIRRVLKPEGVFFFTVPYIWPLQNVPHDFYRYTPFSLKKLLGETGFTDCDVKALSGWDASLAQMMGLWLKRAPMSNSRRQAMAQKLWPIYQELVQTDQLPADSEVGDTMATGWRGLAFASEDAQYGKGN